MSFAYGASCMHRSSHMGEYGSVEAVRDGLAGPCGLGRGALGLPRAWDPPPGTLLSDTDARYDLISTNQSYLHVPYNHTQLC